MCGGAERGACVRLTRTLVTGREVADYRCECLAPFAGAACHLSPAPYECAVETATILRRQVAGTAREHKHDADGLKKLERMMMGVTYEPDLEGERTPEIQENTFI